MHRTLKNYPALLCFLALFACLPAAHLHADQMVHSLDGKILSVHFDQAVLSPSAITTTNYTVIGKGAGTIVVTNAVLQNDDQTVALYLASSTGEFFIVGISNVVGTATNNIQATVTGYLNYLGTASVGSSTNPLPAGSVISYFRDTFDVIANGSGVGGTNDHCHLVFDTVVGDFDLITLVSRLDNSSTNTMAGLMARENTTAGSRSLGIYFTPVIGGSNQIATLIRSTNNTVATAVSQPVAARGLNWLRMTRNTNLFTVYYSSNAVNWTAVGSTNVAWNTTMNIGATATSGTNGINTTASFASFNVNAAHPGDNLIPTLNIVVISNSIVARWQRTPRDFAIQIANNLFDTNTTSGSTNPPSSPWGFLMLPINDTSISGTNIYMPTNGRYMNIPKNIFGGGNVFIRMQRVEKVFPDPLNVMGGITLSSVSPKNGLSGTTTTTTLCSTTVETSAAYLTNGTTTVCYSNYSYKFSTENSAAGLHTALQLNARISGQSPFQIACLGSNTIDYAANNYRAMITLPVHTLTSNYTFTATAAKNTGFKNLTNTPIYVDITIFTNPP